MFNITRKRRPLLLLLFCCQLLYSTTSQQVAKEAQNHAITNNSSTTVQLLVMLPGLSAYQNHSDVASWDRGAEIMPGAEIAVETINKDPNTLRGYQLELIKVDIDRCIQDKAYSNINAFLTFSPCNRSHEPNTLGVIGLFCPELVKLVSPIAGRQNESDLFQLSGSASPHLRNQMTRYRYLSFIVPSSASYYKTAFKFIQQFQWRRMFIVSDSFFDMDSVLESTAMTNEFEITFREFTQPYSAVIKELRLSEKNIVFAALNAKKTAKMLCLSYKAGLTGPEYVWIIQDHDVNDLLSYVSENCPRDVLLKAIESVFLFRYQYQPPEDDIELVSGDTYNKFYAEYLRRVGDLKPNLFANVLHDSVWAFAIALNETLEYINTSNSRSVVDYVQHFGKSEITNIMRDRLEETTFHGASGDIHFNNLSDVEAIVNIFQLGVNGTPTQIGWYDQQTGKINLTLSTVSPLPPDKLPYKYNLIPNPLVATFSTICGFCIVFTTVVLILFFYYRRQSKEIKAASPNLSILMFVGCYLLFGATFVHSISAAFAITGRAIGITLCGTIITGDTIGVNLIFVTLLLRMLRIFRIFSYFGKTGKLWSDKVLLAILIVIVGGDVLLIVVWMCIDTFEIEDIITYKPDGTPPYYEVVQFCSSNRMDVWLSLVLLKIGILFAIVLFLAVKTRKIRKENFKDTKKVNIYIFVTVMIISTIIPLWFLLKSTGNSTGVYVAVYLSFGLIGVLCLAFLFIPKISPPFLRMFGWHIEYDEELQTRTLTRRPTRASTVTLHTHRPSVTSFALNNSPRFSLKYNS